MMDGMGSMVSLFGLAGMWAVLLALLAWALDRMVRPEERTVVVRAATAEDVLRERLACGEISAREFEDALRSLRDS